MRRRLRALTVVADSTDKRRPSEQQLQRPRAWRQRRLIHLRPLPHMLENSLDQRRVLNRLAIYVLAMTVHFIVVNHSLAEEHGKIFRRYGHWVLAASALAGWAMGTTMRFSEITFARLSAVLAGGVVIMSLRAELPADRTVLLFCVTPVDASGIGGSSLCAARRAVHRLQLSEVTQRTAGRSSGASFGRVARRPRCCAMSRSMSAKIALKSGSLRIGARFGSKSR